MSWLKALEGVIVGDDHSNGSPSNMMNAVPGIDPENEVKYTGIELSPEEESKILLFMFEKQLGAHAFNELMVDTADELEIYGLIRDAKQGKAYANAMLEKRAKSMTIRPITMAAIAMAIDAGDPAAKAYLKAEEDERKALSDIMEKYQTDAYDAISKILADNQRRAMTMNGHTCTRIQNLLRVLREKIYKPI